MLNVSPIMRGLSTLLLIAGAIFCLHPWLLGAAWLILLIAAVRSSIYRPHLTLIMVFVVPLALASASIQLLIQLSQHPYQGLLALLASAAMTALVLILHVAVIAAAMQLCVLPILFDGRMLFFLRSWKFSDDAIVVVMAAVTLIAEVKLRARQIIDARLARGYGKAIGFRGIQELPLVMLPLVIYLVDTAVKRSSFWVRRNLLSLFAHYSPSHQEKYSRVESITWLVGSATWCIAVLFCRE
jgi:energy-coupling factor transporter transmembrane protein EcfT